MGRQQDAGIAFGEIHLNHGASIFNRLFARVDRGGIMSHLGGSRRSPGWIGMAAINAWCKIAASRGTNDTFLPNSAIGKSGPVRVIVWGNENSQILRGPHLNIPSRRIRFAVPRPRDQISEIFISNREGYSVDAQVKLLPHPTPGPDNQRWLWPLLCESLVEADSSMRYPGEAGPSSGYNNCRDVLLTGGCAPHTKQASKKSGVQ